MPGDHRQKAARAYAPAPAPPILRQARIQQIAIRPFADLQPHGVIIVPCNVPDLDQADLPCIVHHRQASRPAVVEHARPRDPARPRHPHAGSVPSFIDFLVARIGEVVSMLLHECNLPLQLLGHPQIIAVKEGNPPALRLAKGAVSAHRCAAVHRISQKADSGIRQKRPQHPARIVRGAIIHDDQLPIRVGLPLNRRNGIRDILRRVVGRHDN